MDRCIFVDNSSHDVCHPVKESCNDSTNYYRRNKQDRFKVHKCPHCDYTTTGPKSTIQTHIYAKHTEDKDKPYQCTICQKGFAQKANYHIHLERVHGEIQDKTPKEKDIFLYVIKPGSVKPTTGKIVERYNKYMKNPVILKSKINDYKISDTEFLTYNKLYYDKQNKFIKIISLTKKEASEWNN